MGQPQNPLPVIKDQDEQPAIETIITNPSIGGRAGQNVYIDGTTEVTPTRMRDVPAST